jgi:hypothetical protein
MCLYFIHFTSADDRYEDLEGIELADDETAREYAVLDARYLMDEDAAGKVTGDTKLQAEGKADKVAGKVQNTVGSAKDTARDVLDE